MIHLFLLMIGYYRLFPVFHSCAEIGIKIFDGPSLSCRIINSHGFLYIFPQNANQKNILYIPIF